MRRGAVAHAATVDQQIVAAVQRVITSPGSAVVPSRITEIQIYKSDPTARRSAPSVNKWIYSAGSGPVASTAETSTSGDRGNGLGGVLA